MGLVSLAADACAGRSFCWSATSLASTNSYLVRLIQRLRCGAFVCGFALPAYGEDPAIPGRKIQGCLLPPPSPSNQGPPLFPSDLRHLPVFVIVCLIPPSPSEAISCKGQHSISYTLSRNQTVIVEYTHDKDTDMFQVGRSTESPIDFVVTDTISGSQNSDETQITQSTISRFACRIVCDRNAPYTARIFAAGFDSSKNIFLGEKAAKWKNPDGHMDGLTTNGVLVMHPRGGFTEESKPGVWREISVCGDVYTLRETRSAQQRGKLVENETNVLQDGSLVDLCGATLLWRTADGLFHTPTQKHIEALRQEINAARPQCPVGLNTLAFPSINRKEVVEEKQPWAYLSCGHVHGYHNWGHRSDTEANERECPMCRTVGPYVPLWLGCEAGFYVDAGPPTYAFTPCGHVCSEKSAKYWSQIPLPHGTHAFHAACPFCATQLSGEQNCVKLIFQGPID
ncbi:UNVERIFIED_CONTAM: E3 ubiquitin-protein ligase pellino 2 [Gekko kuhli]